MLEFERVLKAIFRMEEDLKILKSCALSQQWDMMDRLVNDLNGGLLIVEDLVKSLNSVNYDENLAERDKNTTTRKEVLDH